VGLLEDKLDYMFLSGPMLMQVRKWHMLYCVISRINLVSLWTGNLLVQELRYLK